ncbi:MAG: ABC transporter ATP-binding protein [Chloroflexi bacterium]|nr:ABC transporter ATP-binding protein [Chloroflexota bacterium]
MSSLRRMTSFMRPYRWVAFFMAVTVILPVAMELTVPRILRSIIDQGIAQSNFDAILHGSGLMLAAALVGAVATLGQGVCRARISQGLAYDMRNALFAHINTFSFANLDRLKTGELMTRLASDVDLIRMFMSAGLALLLRALVMVVGSVMMMFILDWQLALITLVMLPLAAMLIWGMLRLAQPLFMIVQAKLSTLNTIVQENLAGVQVVKAFVRERFEVSRFAHINDDYMQENIKVGRITGVALPILTILTNLGLVAVIWFGGVSTINGRLTLGELVAFNNYVLIGMAPLLMFGNILTMVSRADASAERIWQVFDMEPIIKVAADARKTAVSGQVQFKDVSFHYNGVLQNEDISSQNGDVAHSGGRDVLNQVSFSVTPGQRVALLGATGSGKSSLVNLIPRFYDSNNGRIEIDGIDVRDWEPEALRKQIGVVLQQSILFSGTVRENIAYGQPNASQDAVIAAAKAAQAHDFITRMPDGYDSMVEERGANLSGGQKQRIAIARALLIAPSILILDDSTSAVDLETEAKIQHALDTLMHNRTTFIVAQRINSVLSADKILVLDNGRIVAEGTHNELVTSSAIYQEIYHSQLGN